MSFELYGHISICLKEIRKVYSTTSLDNPRYFVLVRFKNLSQLLIRAYGLKYFEEFQSSIKRNLAEINTLEIFSARFLMTDYLLIVTSGNLLDEEEPHTVISKNISKILQEKYQLFNTVTTSVKMVNCNYDIVDIINKLIYRALEKKDDEICSENSLNRMLFEGKLELEKVNKLHGVVKNDKSFMHYQPIFDIKENKNAYYECLLRIYEGWELKSAYPYILSAEKLEVSEFIDKLVIDHIPNILSKYPDKKFSFNFSSYIANNKSLSQNLANMLSNGNLGKRTIIEITETANHIDLKSLSEFIHNLHKLDVQVAMDDFGVGSTNIEQLKSLPFDIVKIDGSFIKNLLNEQENQCVVKFISEFAKLKKFSVVAEFVETKEISDYLVKLGIYKMQGHYYGASSSEPI